MRLEPSQVETTVLEQHERHPFSGVVQVREDARTVFAAAFGRANRAEAIDNTTTTRFGTASGTKSFTAVAVCQLIEAGKLSPDTRLIDVVDAAFPRFDPAITIAQLLTHTSGAPDYFDEEQLDAQTDFSALFDDLPTYRVRAPADILPLFRDLPMKSAPGGRFHYNNGGFVLLGLAIEAVSGMAYADYVEQHVFARAGMADSGFFELDALPSRSALGYLANGRTNIYQIPVKGMPDGGAFVTGPNMASFWDALLGYHLLGSEMTARFLQPRVEAGSGDRDDTYYGYGLWMTVADGTVTRYSCSGADPGVAFVSAHYPADQLEVTLLGNTEAEAWPLFSALQRLVTEGSP